MIVLLSFASVLKSLGDDFTDVLRKCRGVAYALERCTCMALPAFIEFPVAIESACDARRDLRVQLVECDDLLRHELVATAVGGMETDVVRSERADQRVDLVRVPDRERRMRGEPLHLGQRARQS